MRCDEVISELAIPTETRDQTALAEHLAACPACADWARRAERLDQLWEATHPAEPAPEAWDAVWANVAEALPYSMAIRPAGLPAAGAAPSRNGSGPKILVHAGPAPAIAPAVSPTPSGPQPRGRSWRLAGIALVALAQAAAILIALGLAWRPQPRVDRPAKAAPSIAQHAPPAVPVAIRSATPVEAKMVIPENSLIMIQIHVEGSGIRVASRGNEVIPGVGGLVQGQKRAWVVDVTPEEMNVSADVGMVILNVMESVAMPQVAAR